MEDSTQPEGSPETSHQSTTSDNLLATDRENDADVRVSGCEVCVASNSINEMLKNHERERLYVPPLLWNSQHLDHLRIGFIDGFASANLAVPEQGQAADDGVTTPMTDVPSKVLEYVTSNINCLGPGYKTSRKTVEMREILYEHDLYRARNHELRFNFSNRPVIDLSADGLFALSVSDPACLAYLDLDDISDWREFCIMGSDSRRRKRSEWKTRTREKELARLQPSDAAHDPYIAAVMIGLAQGRRKALPHDPLRVSVIGTFEENMYFFTADISKSFLDRLDNPRHGASCVEDVSIYHHRFSLRSPKRICMSIQKIVECMRREK